VNLLYLLSKIDSYISNNPNQNPRDVLLHAAVNPIIEFELGFYSQKILPYSQNTPWSLSHDSDQDGIPDALDNYFGPGANNHDF